MKHTPGPWKANIDNNGDYIVTIRSYRRVYVNATYEDDDNVKYDASLIAAAPEMYEAIRWLLHLRSGVSKGGDDFRVTDDEWNDAWESAISAITKAEGNDK